MESRKACSEAIKIEDEPRLYCDRAESYLLEDMYDEVRRIKQVLYFVYNFRNFPNPGIFLSKID